MAKPQVESVEVQLFNGVYSALVKVNMPEDKALKYANFALELYRYIKDDPKLQMVLATKDMVKETKGAQAAFRYADGARNLQLGESAERFAAKGEAGVGGAISAFVEYFAGFAKATGIEINDCAIAVTKVMLDVLTVVALSETVVGVWAAALQTLSTVKDIHEMADKCMA